MYSRHMPNVQRMTEPNGTRARRAEAFEEWAGRVDAADLQAADTESLRVTVELVNCREDEEMSGLDPP